MTNILVEYERPALKTVDGRLLTDRHTHRHTDRQTDRHDQKHDSCPSPDGQL